MKEEGFVSHPKLSKLSEIVQKHFEVKGEETRVMIFSQFRDSVEEIVEYLKKNGQLIKPAGFVGQATSTGVNKTKGLNQKAQQEMIDQFKQGELNTLVCTSIGEEGLDIGEVDLIVCFDTQNSPTRMLQRMGRTGRKRRVPFLFSFLFFFFLIHHIHIHIIYLFFIFFFFFQK